MNEHTNEWMNAWSVWHMKWRSRFSLVHMCIFCRRHLPKVFRAIYFLSTFSRGYRPLARVSRAFYRPHLLQVLRPQQFFTIFMWNRGLATVSCAFCRPLSRIEPRTRGNRDFLRRPRQPLYPKKCRVSRPRVFSNLNSRVPDFPHIPTTTCMMMWLPWWLRWWCGCHHGEKANHDNRS